MKLKVIALLLITLVSAIEVSAQDSASSILENALISAKAENKNVFVKYSASWCRWCKVMDKKMKSEQCKSFFNDNYVTVTLIVKEREGKKHLENPGALDFLNKHIGGKKAGLPFWVIIDHSGNLLEDSFNANGKNIGCPGAEEEVEEFVSILKKTSSLSKKDLKVIAQTFLSK
ncbi:DUF255 domain-containing protein [Reichenbachiella sp.]|uniref:DUF255 domain-containing protein n=1 Tax=Reichenbachiella sp. TaxID=2184521 RepID=UPI003298F69C